jgi:excisionase family DNA binding protein
METFEKMYSVKEAAGLLGVSRDSVVRLIDGGHIVAVRFPRMGGKGRGPSRIEESELVSFKQRNKKRGR